MSTCPEGLACGIDDTCHGWDTDPPPTYAQLGQRCGGKVGDYIDCDDGLGCLDGRCVTAAHFFEPCSDEVPCSRFGWCQEGLCAEKLDAGAQCPSDATGRRLHSACKSGVCLTDGQCAGEIPKACTQFFW